MKVQPQETYDLSFMYCLTAKISPDSKIITLFFLSLKYDRR